MSDELQELGLKKKGSTGTGKGGKRKLKRGKAWFWRPTHSRLMWIKRKDNKRQSFSSDAHGRGFLLPRHPPVGPHCRHNSITTTLWNIYGPDLDGGKAFSLFSTTRT